MQTVPHSTRIKQSLLLSAGHFTTCRHLHLWQFWEPKWLCLNSYLSLRYFRCWPLSKITFEILMQWFLAHSDKQQGRAYFPIAGLCPEVLLSWETSATWSHEQKQGQKGSREGAGSFLCPRQVVQPWHSWQTSVQPPAASQLRLLCTFPGQSTLARVTTRFQDRPSGAWPKHLLLQFKPISSSFAHQGHEEWNSSLILCLFHVWRLILPSLL